MLHKKKTEEGMSYGVSFSPVHLGAPPYRKDALRKTNGASNVFRVLTAEDTFYSVQQNLAIG